MYECIVIAEGEFEGKHTFKTKEELWAFDDGIGIAANLYGAGSCMVVTKDEIGEHGEDVDALIKEHLG